MHTSEKIGEIIRNSTYGELYEFKLAIAGGEDAPGSANSMTIDEAREYIEEKRRQWFEDQNTIEALRAENARLRGALRDSLFFAEVISTGRDEGDAYAASDLARCLRSLLEGASTTRGMKPSKEQDK